MGRFVFTLRIATVMGVILVMPLLAVPRLNSLINRLLHKDRASRYSTKAELGRIDSLAFSEENSPSAAKQSVAEIEVALRQLGALDVSLRVNESQSRYEAECRLQLHGNPVYSRRFRAAGATPVAALTQLLADAEAWTEASNG